MPVEIVFDQGLGDLFVIRVAGNIVAPSQIGSVEFAAEQFGTRLVVVLGHSNCGAIQATLEQLQRPKENQSRNLHSIVDLVRPSVESLLATDLKHDLDALVHQAVRANIRASVNHLRHGSEIIEQLIQKDGLLVVGAEYSLETGEVDFFEDAGALGRSPWSRWKISTSAVAAGLRNILGNGNQSLDATLDSACVTAGTIAAPNQCARSSAG